MRHVNDSRVESERLRLHFDRIGEFAQQVKQAINQANKTELAELD